MIYITIDGGTTNTRISLVKSNKTIKTVKLSMGARSGIGGSDELKREIKEAVLSLQDILGGNEHIERILASGMITSEFGLYNLPHLSAPAGVAELNLGMHEEIIADISDIPFVFVPGIKAGGDLLENTDMMRGEETELIGLCEKLQCGCIYVLPGSHSKLIKTDEQGRVSSFVTTLTGEMIFALSQSTILKDAVDFSQKETDFKYLDSGYKYCCRKGINEALFKTRVLKNIFKASPCELYSFYLGVVLCAEINELIKAEENKIIIGGKEQIKNAMIDLLSAHCQKEIVSVPAEDAANAPSRGMIRIYEYNKNK